jgi:beta-lactamase class D
MAKQGWDILRKKNGILDRTRQIGWFVGWAEKEDRTIIFVRFSEDEKDGYEPFSAGQRAKQYVRSALIEMTR